MQERENLKMSEAVKILIAGLIVLAVGIPSVIILSKWKEEMEEDLNKTDDAKRGE